MRPSDTPEMTDPTNLICADTPTDEANEMIRYWKEQGPEIYAEAMTTIMRDMAATASEIESVTSFQNIDKDTMLTYTRLGKYAKDASEKLYYAGRNALWEMVQHRNGKHVTLKGEAFRFKAGPHITTRVNRQQLKTEFPEVYAAVTTTTRRDTNKPGNLYL